MKKTALIHAVAYIRMSTDDQKDSPKQQRKQIEAHAKRNGFKIIRWYSDEGKSGSKQTEKRTAFLKMLSDADAGEFSVILCLDISRFGRLDSIEGALAKKTLRDAGVKLHTILEGDIDWTTTTGRIVDAVLSEAQHDFSVRMGQKTLKGKLDAFLDGKMFGFKVPYGYARKITDTQGVSRIIPRTEEFTKPKKWTGTLIEGDPDEVQVVRWLYSTFATRDVGFRWLAAELNKQGTPSPTGLKWYSKIVQEILTNEKYVGDMALGKKLSGDFWRLAGNEVQRVNGNAQKIDRTQPPLLINDTHDRLVEREEWNAVQAKAKRRKASHSHSKGNGGYVLKDVLYCGHCGKPLYGNPNKSGPNAVKRKSGRTRYVCKTAIKFGKQCDCGQWGVHEDEVLPFLKDKLVSEVKRKVLTDASIYRELDAQPKETAALERKLDAMNAKIDKGAERFLSAPPELTDELAKKLQEWKDERKALVERIEEEQRPDDDQRNWTTRLHDLCNAAEEDLIFVERRHGNVVVADPLRKDSFRELLVSNGCRLDFWWKRSSSHRWAVAKIRLRLFGSETHLLEPSLR